MANAIYNSMTELQFINYLYLKNSLSPVKENSIDSSYFTTYKEHFEFIEDYFNKYNALPSKESFQAKFSDNFDWINVTDTEDYLVDRLNESKLYRDMISDYKDVGNLIKNEQTDKAIEKLSVLVQQYTKNKKTSCVDLIDDANQRFDSYIERLNNPNEAFVTTGLKELDDILGGWDRKNETATICARTGVGKCLEKGTKVLMADGSTKKVEDVKIGDKVQSINGVNNVLCLHNGVSGGWKIVPKRGDSFVVSDDHIMTFMHWVSKGEWELVDMKIEDFNSLTAHEKRMYELYKPELEYETKCLLIPPYIMGLWLGDGTSCRPELTTMDDELKEEWEDYAKSMGMKITCHTKKFGKASTYDMVRLSNDGKTNTVKDILKSYNVLNNKHIPLDYLTSDRNQRLELLAGLVDTDGYVNGNAVFFSFKSSELINNVKQLATSLGMRVGKIGTKHIKGNDYYTISISGATPNIPVRLKRKVAIPTKCCDSRPFNLTRFDVERVDRVEYYGFMCDGDSRYLLSDGTVTHNTWWLVYFAMAAAKAGLRVGYYSGEMEIDLVGYRFDTFLGNLANGSLTHGNANVRDQYTNYIESLNKVVTGHIYCVTPDNFDGKVTVNKLDGFIEKYKIDLMCIDQFSLLDDQRGAKTPREQAVNISKDLRTLQRMRKIPMLLAVQSNREEYEEGLNTRNIAEADRIGQDSTTVLFIERDGDNVIIKVGKSRNAKTGDKLTYVWNVNLGTLHYIPTEDDANDGAGSEALLESYKDSARSDSVF